MEDKARRLYSQNEEYIHKTAKIRAQSIRQTIGSAGDADWHDWAQEIEIGIFRGLETYDGRRAGVRTFISVIATSRTRDIAARELAKFMARADEPPPEPAAPAYAFAAQTLPERIWAAISAIEDPTEREACSLYFAGESMRTISARLGITPKRVKAILRAKMAPLASEMGLLDPL